MVKTLIVATAFFTAALGSASEPAWAAAVLTTAMAYSDPCGVGGFKSSEPGSNQPPAYDSVHLMEDDRIAEIGWIGIHAFEYRQWLHHYE